MPGRWSSSLATLNRLITHTLKSSGRPGRPGKERGADAVAIRWNVKEGLQVRVPAPAAHSDSLKDFTPNPSAPPDPSAAQPLHGTDPLLVQMQRVQPSRRRDGN